MIGPNFNRSQLLNDLREQQIRSSIEQFSLEIKILQSRLASELQVNRFLLSRANEQPKIQNIMKFTPPEFNFCFNDSNLLAPQQVVVKKQDNQVYQENSQKKVTQEPIKFASKTSEYQQKEDFKNMIKIQSNSGLKIQEKSQSQKGQTHEKNETKNIPKNYGKAILSFIQKNIQKYLSVVKPILHRQKLTVSDLLNHIKKHKKQVNSIHYLKVMWGFQNFNDPIFKCIRILSYTFMRKYCLSYIFNSRIKNYNTHIKYRKRMLQGIENPAQFTYIKQF